MLTLGTMRVGGAPYSEVMPEMVGMRSSSIRRLSRCRVVVIIGILGAAAGCGDGSSSASVPSLLSIPATQGRNVEYGKTIDDGSGNPYQAVTFKAGDGEVQGFAIHRIDHPDGPWTLGQWISRIDPRGLLKKVPCQSAEGRCIEIVDSANYRASLQPDRQDFATVMVIEAGDRLVAIERLNGLATPNSVIYETLQALPS